VRVAGRSSRRIRRVLTIDASRDDVPSEFDGKSLTLPRMVQAIDLSPPVPVQDL